MGSHVIIHGGDACQAIVEAFRRAFPEHYPTRIDVCFDFQGDKAYDKLYGLALKTKRKFDIQCEKWAIDRQSAGARSSSAGRSPRIRRSSTKKATNKGKRTSTQTHRLTGYGSSFGYIPPRNPRSRRRSSNRNRSHALAGGRTTSAISSELPRSSGQARHPEQKPRCVESAENMYRQYQRKLAETVKDK